MDFHLRGRVNRALWLGPLQVSMEGGGSRRGQAWGWKGSTRMWGQGSNTPHPIGDQLSPTSPLQSADMLGFRILLIHFAHIIR